MVRPSSCRATQGRGIETLHSRDRRNWRHYGPGKHSNSRVLGVPHFAEILAGMVGV